MKNPIAAAHIREMREVIQRLQDESHQLARTQRTLNENLNQALQQELEAPLDGQDVSEFRAETFADSAAPPGPLTGDEPSRVQRLKGQLLRGLERAGDLAQKHVELTGALNAALRDELELRQAEWEERNDLGGEG